MAHNASLVLIGRIVLMLYGFFFVVGLELALCLRYWSWGEGDFGCEKRDCIPVLLGVGADVGACRAFCFFYGLAVWSCACVFVKSSTVWLFVKRLIL